MVTKLLSLTLIVSINLIHAIQEKGLSDIKFGNKKILKIIRRDGLCNKDAKAK